MGLNLSGMTTETCNPRTMQLDQMSPLEIVTVMNEEDARVPLAIAKCLPQIAQAVTWAAESFEKGGRLIYMGAGTSGRLGVLDAAECPPTFGVPKEMVVGLIAGGEKAFIEAVEGAEDSRELAVEDLKAHGLTANDLVVGIAASGRTPYVLGGLDYAKSVGCHTAAIACNIGSAIGKAAELAGFHHKRAAGKSCFKLAVVGESCLTGCKFQCHSNSPSDIIFDTWWEYAVQAAPCFEQ